MGTPAHSDTIRTNLTRVLAVTTRHWQMAPVAQYRSAFINEVIAKPATRQKRRIEYDLQFAW